MAATSNTLTAKQLIEVLQTFDQDTDVLCTWDGLLVDVRAENISVYEVKDGHTAIVIDVSEY